jgi:hypothetical protein
MADQLITIVGMLKSDIQRLELEISRLVRDAETPKDITADPIERRRIHDRNRNQIKVSCACGGEYRRRDRNRHMQSKKHRQSILSNPLL